MEDRIYCEACADLRQQDPNFIANGFSEDNELHMRLDEGLTGDNDDCTDLNNMNDCLIGLMDDEATIGEICDWPSFIHKFVPNLWTVFKAIISSVCGLWTAVHSFWLRKDGKYIYLDAWDGEHGRVIDSDTTYTLSGGGDTVTLNGSDGSRSSVTVGISDIMADIEQLYCIVGYMNAGAEFTFGEGSSGESHIVAGKGVSYLNVGESGLSNNIIAEYIAGGLMRLKGSCLFYDSNFTDRKPCYSFDTNGVTPVYTSSRTGNPGWTGTNTKPNGNGSELVYELRVKMSEYPQINEFVSGISTNAEGGGYHAEVIVYPAGLYANGQHGRCDDYTGDPANANSDRGHLVPTGWTYIQLRITWIESMHGDGTQYTPGALFGVRMNPEEIDC